MRAAPQTISATTGPKRAKRDGGSTEPSRTAAMGGTRVARNAGQRLAASVTPIPTPRATSTVRVANTSPFSGSPLIPTTLSRALRPSARPRPTNSPIAEARVPVTSPSTTTTPRTCREVAPIVRKVANSRARCAIVIESVLAITNAPTNRAMPPKASRK